VSRRASSLEDGDTSEEDDEEEVTEEKPKLKQMVSVLTMFPDFSGLNRKLQLKPASFKEDHATGAVTVTEAQLVLKWGGELTAMGAMESTSLGRNFRTSMFPNEGTSGGLLRLHATMR
jgi:inositol hexakisphosphate/diphosphoinositol-pentakisphosphate kinase